MHRLYRSIIIFSLCILALSNAYANTEKGLNKQQLHQLLLAEFAHKRGQPKQAATIFLEQAKALNSAQLAEKASYLAYQQKQHEQFLEAATLWQKLAPESERANLLKSLAHQMNQQYARALESMTRYFQQFNNSHFTELVSSLPAEHRSSNLYRQQLEQLSLDKNTNGDILLANALLAQRQENPELANEFAWKAIKKQPDNTASTAASLRLLQANNSKRTNKAFLLLLKKQPENDKLRQQYALHLAKSDLNGATEQFYRLIKAQPDNESYRYQLGLVELENQQFSQAKKHFTTLTNGKNYHDDAHYYLGIIANLEEQYSQALTHFEQVKKAPLAMDAKLAIGRIQLTQKQWQKLHTNIQQALATPKALGNKRHIDWLLIRSQSLLAQGQYQAAINTATKAINIQPNALELYYQRAMIYAKNQQLDAMEQDLRHILSLEPEHAEALNALGFTFADHNIRLDEAYALIKKAYQLSPKEPAILDSMGWVYYRRGKPKKALDFLEAAMQKLPDPEIAAHLGEVLWQVNKIKKANAVWQKSIKQNPDHKILYETIQRFNSQLLQNCQHATGSDTCQ